ncbi:LOW QUALITY PROTEIN: pterocarpan synthase 1 [Curcuma longa]|uniref:LOW QUALITY PROTEIN: pterocarpan synthase 1 n=1 Tax=Curcuma longa TaxID=136217 RepID=UPI003D9F89A8
MLARIIFFVAVAAAILVVILLPLLSRLPEKAEESQLGPWLALSLFVHIPAGGAAWEIHGGITASLDGGHAFVFRHKLKEGPSNTSRVVGEAQGVVVPVRQRQHAELELSAFNIVHLALDAPAYRGSLAVEARRGRRREELVVVGGTGAFAFARGYADFTAVSSTEAVYRLDVQLRLPRKPPTIPGPG